LCAAKNPNNYKKTLRSSSEAVVSKRSSATCGVGSLALIVQLVSGGVGGNIAGSALKQYD
jgi:hypothetical protein